MGRFPHRVFRESHIRPVRRSPRSSGCSTAPPPIEWVEAINIVNAVGFHPPTDTSVDWLPSMRMVIDLSDLAASTSVNTTGQSGHAFHTHYDDMLVTWTDGTHHPMRWTREQVDDGSEGTLRLQCPIFLRNMGHHPREAPVPGRRAVWR